MTEQLIRITEPAQKYLREMMFVHGGEGIGVRIFIEDPGTLHAECGLDYCSKGECGGEDQLYEYSGFHVVVEARNIGYLKDAVIDFQKGCAGGELVFHAPNLWTLEVGQIGRAHV